MLNLLCQQFAEKAERRHSKFKKQLKNQEVKLEANEKLIAALTA